MIPCCLTYNQYNFIMKTKYSHLILTGSISIDRIMNFKDSYKNIIQPDKLHVLSLSVFIDKLTNSRGGVAANIAYNLALIGEKPILLASIGNDASDYLADMKKLGINCDYVHQSMLPTATFTVLTDKDDNQVGGFYPGAMSDSSSLNLKPWYKHNPLVVISAGDPTSMENLINECKDHNLDYIFDVGQQVTNLSAKQLKAGVAGAKILTVNDYELATLCTRTGYSMDKLNRLVPIIITTLGSQGTKVSGHSVSPQTIKAVSNIEIVDPTGAGDSYRAGFLYGYLRNWEISDCIKFGSVIATYTISMHGTQTHTFNLAELNEKHYSAYGTHIPN